MLFFYLLGTNVLQLGGAQNLLLPENSNRQFSHMNQVNIRNDYFISTDLLNDDKH